MEPAGDFTCLGSMLLIILCVLTLLVGWKGYLVCKNLFYWWLIFGGSLSEQVEEENWGITGWLRSAVPEVHYSDCPVFRR